VKSLFRIFDILRPYIGHVALALIFLLLITTANLVVPEIIQRVIDIGLVGGDPRFLLNAALVILGIGLFNSIIDFGNRYLNSWIAYRVTFDLRNRLYDHIQHLSFSYHDYTQTGQLINRCIEDVRSVQQFMGCGPYSDKPVISRRYRYIVCGECQAGNISPHTDDPIIFHDDTFWWTRRDAVLPG